MTVSFSVRRFFTHHLPVIAFWWLVWEGANLLVDASIIIVSPREAFARLFALAGTHIFWVSTGQTLSRVLLGFFLALAAGVLLAAMSKISRAFYRLILPAINVLNAIPIASFVLLALMAIPATHLAAFIAFVTVLPIVFYNTYKGIEATDAALLEMAAVFRIPTWKTIVYIYLKSVSPYVLSAANVGIGFAWKSGIAAELIGLVAGTIGFHLHSARIWLNTADLFAWTIAIVLLSCVMEKIIVLLIERMTKWQSS